MPVARRTQAPTCSRRRCRRHPERTDDKLDRVKSAPPPAAHVDDRARFSRLSPNVAGHRNEGSCGGSSEHLSARLCGSSPRIDGLQPSGSAAVRGRQISMFDPARVRAH